MEENVKIWQNAADAYNASRYLERGYAMPSFISVQVGKRSVNKIARCDDPHGDKPRRLAKEAYRAWLTIPERQRSLVLASRARR